MCVYIRCVLVNQSCPTLCDPMDCSLPDSLSVEFSRQEYRSGYHLLSRWSSWPSDQTQVSCITGQFFAIWATREAHICICEVKVTQSCQTLCDLTDYRVHGILQTRILEWVAFPFSRGSSQPRDRTQVPCIVDRFFFTSWATGKPIYMYMSV